MSRATCPSPQSANWNDSNLILVPDIPTYSSSLASSRKIFQVSTWLLRSEATCPQIYHWTPWKSMCGCSPKAEEVYNEKLVGDLVLMLLWYLEHENWHYCLGMFYAMCSSITFSELKFLLCSGNLFPAQTILNLNIKYNIHLLTHVSWHLLISSLETSLYLNTYFIRFFSPRVFMLYSVVSRRDDGIYDKDWDLLEKLPEFIDAAGKSRRRCDWLRLWIC